MTLRLPGAAALLVLLALQPAAAEPRLVMIGAPNCEYCAQWEAEVGVVFDRTAEGRQVALERRTLAAPAPEGARLARGIRYTPTFVLLCQGAETGRIEGYPGEDFFWPMLRRLLDRAAGAAGDLARC
jgi:hypothetical protein